MSRCNYKARGKGEKWKMMSPQYTRYWDEVLAFREWAAKNEIGFKVAMIEAMRARMAMPPSVAPTPS